MEREPRRIRTRLPVEQGQPWEFAENFNLILREHGLTHRYSYDHRFIKHEILQPQEKRFLGRRFWTTYRPVARIFSDSKRDHGSPKSYNMPHDGLVIMVLKPEDQPVIEKIVDSLLETYPDEPIILTNPII